MHCLLKDHLYALDVCVGVCLTYDNDRAIKREDTAWQEGRDIWWQVSFS